MTSEAERHRTFAGTFLSVAEATHDWNAATPVKEWRAADIVDHLLNWLPPVLQNWANIDIPPATGQTPTARWAGRAAAVQNLLDSPQHADHELTQGPFAGERLDRVVDRIYSTDVYMHTWDLARSNGVAVTLDPQYAHELLEGMREIESVLRESGEYGPPTRTDSEDPVDRLMAFVGRQV